MKQRQDYFIAGTDTDVGKTVVTTALLAALRASGIDAVAMKPVQTGSKRGRSHDLDFCSRVARWKIPADEFDDLCPYRFPFPASPHLAARLARQAIDPAGILEAFRRLQRRHEAILVEGAGGLLVPLTPDFDQGDLIKRLGLPAILVARPGLGTLNHTLLTIEALKRRRIAIAAVVLSGGTKARGRIEGDNGMFLQAKLRPITVISLRRMDAATSGTMSRAGGRLLRQIRS